MHSHVEYDENGKKEKSIALLTRLVEALGEVCAQVRALGAVDFRASSVDERRVVGELTKGVDALQRLRGESCIVKK